MSTCGTCKHFGERLDIYDDDDLNCLVKTKYAYCGLLQTTSGREVPRDLNGPPACVVDGSGYFAALCVSDEFGCNQWDKRIVPNEDAPQTREQYTDHWLHRSLVAEAKSNSKLQPMARAHEGRCAEKGD